MKQITLYPNSGGSLRAAPCAASLAFCWAAYGFTMAALWWALPRSPVADAAAWLGALACGFCLAAWMKEA